MNEENAKSTNREQYVIAIWKAAVDVQQHFNDIEMRIRSLFVTILLALFASTGFMLDKQFDFVLWGWNIKFAVLIPLFGLLGTYLFYFIDRYWYHRLLVGAVRHAIKIEEAHKEKFPELLLSSAIGAESPFEPKGVTRLLAKLLVRDERYRQTGMLHSDGKIEFFYKSVMLLLVTMATVLAVLGGVSSNGRASGKEATAASAPLDQIKEKSK
jgi:hypothetical protein